MKIAFLNLCHCDPVIVARTARRLTENPNMDMYIHVDLKSDIQPFIEALDGQRQVYFVKDRRTVYWGGFGAIEATIALLKGAVASDRKYDRFVILQNLDYPLKGNSQILHFFEKNSNKEFIRACKIAKSKDWHFQEKYKLFHDFDDPFYLTDKRGWKRIFHNVKKVLKSVKTIGFDGVIHEKDGDYPIYYGAAQWAVTRECAEYFIQFYETHPYYNQKMRHIKFPDEEYFHTIVHNSRFKYQCHVYDEPEKRWLVNWRNLHYYEYPGEIVVFTKEDYPKLRRRKELFVRKVRSGISDELLDLLDEN